MSELGGGTLLEAKGVSGREWRLRMVKTVGGGGGLSGTTVAVVEDQVSGMQVCAKRQFAESQERVNLLVREAALWKQVGVTAVATNGRMPGCVQISESAGGSSQWPSSIALLLDCILFASKPPSVVFLMEYYPSPQLPLTNSEEKILSIARDICEGLVLMYDAGITNHGNLAIDNVMLGPDGRARIGGFGRTRIRESGAIKDDAYALGLILYELRFQEKPPSSLTSRAATFEPPPSKRCSSGLLALLKLLLGEHKHGLGMDMVRYEIAILQGLVPKTALVKPARNKKKEKAERKLARELTSDTGMSQTEKAPVRPQRTPAQQNPRIEQSPVATGYGPPKPATHHGSVSQSDASEMGVSGQQSVSTKAPLPRSESPANAPQVADSMSPAKSTGTAGAMVLPSRRRGMVTTTELRESITPANGLSVLKSLSEKLKSKRKENSSLDSLISKVVDTNPSPLNEKYLRYHLVESDVRPNYCAELFEALKKKPLQKSRNAAFKAVALLHRLSLEGPAEFQKYVISEDEFLSWLELCGKPEKNESDLSFINGEVAAFAELVNLKGVFQGEFSSVFAPNWSRSIFDAGRDPIQGRRTAVLMGVKDILEQASSLVQALTMEQNSSELARSAIPALMVDITAAYTSACLVVEGGKSEQNESFISAFRDCHTSTSDAMSCVTSKPAIASLCKEEVLLKLSSDPLRISDSAEPMASATSSQSIPARPSRMLSAAQKSSVSTTNGRMEAIDPRSNLNPKAAPSARESAGSPLPPLQPKRRSTADVADPFTSALQATSNSAAPIRRGGPGRATPPRVSETPPKAEAPSPDSRDRRYPDQREERYLSDERYNDDKGYRRESPPRDPYERERYDDGRMRYDRRYMDERDRYDDSRRGHRYSLQETRGRNYSEPESGTESDSEASSEEERRKKEHKKKHSKKSRSKSSRHQKTVSDESESEEEERTERHKKDKKDKKEKKSKSKSKKDTSTSRNAHSESDVSHIAEKPIRDLNQLSINPKYIANPREIQYGQQIGQGGFGSVYKGIFRGQVVAIKKAHSSILTSPKAIEEFRREVAVLCALQHPNILRFLGACTQPPHLIIITEFCGRGTLFDYLHKEHQKLSWSLFKKMAMDLCQGMMYLHSSNLLHRDLKSSNLMLGDNFDVKVGDFGLTRVQQTLGPMTGQCGTFQYMAPEVLQSRPYTEKADVFSFGIVLWEMAAQQLPYFGMQPMQVGIAVASQGLRPKLSPEWPQSVKVMMQRCWHADYRQRPSFAQCREFLITLNF